MSDRFQSLRKLRRLREDVRIAEAARAQLAEQQAARRVAEHEQRQDALEAPETPVTPEQLALHRMYGIALSAAASIARDELARMERAARDAERHRADAGIDRRIVERLDARDRAQQALQASRRAELILNEAALHQWRRPS